MARTAGVGQQGRRPLGVPSVALSGDGPEICATPHLCHAFCAVHMAGEAPIEAGGSRSPIGECEWKQGEQGEGWRELSARRASQ